jgi:hypothetical protein
MANWTVVSERGDQADFSLSTISLCSTPDLHLTMKITSDAVLLSSYSSANRFEGEKQKQQKHL